MPVRDMSAPGEAARVGDSSSIESRELAALRLLSEGAAASIGRGFFETLVSGLATAASVKFAFVAEFLGSNRAKTIAYFKNGQIVENAEWDLAGTPCEDVVTGKLCHYPTGVSQKFPQDVPLVEMGVDSYLGIPLLDNEGKSLGHLAIFDDRPMPEDARRAFLLRIFAGRATAELMRLRAEERMRESEQRFRDLFDEAPIAYVHEGLDLKFISANRTAMNILGIKPEDVPDTVGMSFIPDTPDAQRRIREAVESIGRGTDTKGVILELRRKDNGKPIWIQWWSRPDVSGKFTRTMFIDITDRVLMEQEKARLNAQNLYLQEEIKAVHNFDEIVGRSAALADVLRQVSQVAPTDASVLITGETGTGKELIARAIHSHSNRRDKPLIKVNCAALPTGLVESELFGHEKGAFSGAIARRIGRFELAGGGTIFLDEIGEVPLDVQVKLLRVLQEREFERVGGSSSIRADVRVIAATNRDLGKMVREGKFREDLFFRLNVFPIHLPPLRERADDVALLVQFLLSKFANRVGKRIDGVTADTLERLRGYCWPGNIRELENVLERAVILSQGPLVEVPPTALIQPAGSIASISGPASGSLEDVERAHMLSTLKARKWVIDGPDGAARVLDMHPNTLRSRMKKLGITRPAHELS